MIRPSTLGIAGVALLCNLTSATAGLLETLRDNGAITSEQYQNLKKEDDNTIKTSGTSKLKFTEPGYSFQIGGRLYADFADYQDDITPLHSGAELRTARISIKGTFYDNWKFRTQYAFNDNDTQSRYIWLGYQFDQSILRVGRTIESAGLEDFTSSRYITFMERALPSLAFAGDSFAQSVDYRWYNHNAHIFTGVFLQEELDDGDRIGDDRPKFHLRGSYAPINTDSNALHLGAWINYLQPAGNVSRTRVRPEAHVDDNRLLDTGAISNVKDQITGGLELAWKHGPITAQAEYSQRTLKQDNGNDTSLDGFYVSASYFLTGESKTYLSDYGVFDRTTPKSDTGAIEVALRYSQLDLSEAQTALAGKQHNTTLGLNWWPKRNIRFTLNQVLADVTDRPGAPDENVGITQLRAQIDF